MPSSKDRMEQRTAEDMARKSPFAADRARFTKIAEAAKARAEAIEDEVAKADPKP